MCRQREHILRPELHASRPGAEAHPRAPGGTRRPGGRSLSPPSCGFEWRRGPAAGRHCFYPSVAAQEVPLNSVQVVSPRRRCTFLTQSPKHKTPAHKMPQVTPCSGVLNVQVTTSSVPAVSHCCAPEKVPPTKCMNVHVPMLQSIKSVVYSQTITNAQPAGRMSQVRQVMQSPADTLGGDNAPPTVLQVSWLAAHFPQ